MHASRKAWATPTIGRVVPLRWPALTYVALAAAGVASILTADTFLVLPLILGSDWTWYSDGPARMAAGLPLYDPAMLAGPFDYLALGPRWNQAPWALPFVMIPWGHLLWWALMSAALLVGVALLWPRLRNVAGVLTALVVALSAPFIMGMTWGNFQGLAVLGVACWFVGRDRGWWWLEALGIAFAFVKILPAIPLVLWSLDRPKVLVGAAASVAALSVPAILYGGPAVFVDFARFLAGFVPLDTRYNLSPMLWLSPWVVRAVAAAVILVGVRRSPTLAFFGICLLVTNLYADWFIFPIVAALVEFGPHPAGTMGTGPRWLRRASPVPVSR